jgi:hypothetical protein
VKVFESSGESFVDDQPPPSKTTSHAATTRRKNDGAIWMNGRIAALWPGIHGRLGYLIQQQRAHNGQRIFHCLGAESIRTSWARILS